ncbi:MaoC family dehydratase N-terminal domain-containing protein [Microtetraspora sp. NBRC 16547]|uniref:FAS1-like dehydratase domain-containing protein n=1 Tax=Microtetraspora sp. NBRC 16547 TaxID=3030993 RepID=UPI0025530F02|nr:MaoC family dehydratase N-terminal domain-containing protein [Microtetraspora sp. NBRC 16547]
MTEEIRALVGREVSYTAPEELGRAAIRYFARAVGDDNPLYTDDAYARGHGYDGVIAPPTLICETNQYADQPPDADGYAGHDWHIEIPGSRKVRGGNTYTFHEPVRPDDVITAAWRLDGVTERRTSAGQEMLVVSSVATYTNQHGRLLATNEETIIYVAVHVAPEEEP